MGNRAVITTPERKLGIYLHWNGGRDSVEAFLKYCDLRGFRAPDTDEYGWARLCQVIANYMGAEGLSVGISPYTTDVQENPGDNGIYVIHGWEIVERIPDGISEQMECPLDVMLHDIDDAQPKGQQLDDFLDAKEVPTSQLKRGDRVFFLGVDGRYRAYEIKGFGPAGMVVNGRDVEGVPYAHRYDAPGLPAHENINNYVLGATARRLPR